ncbi:hypothetical protein DFR58_11154 [Anaerobacterium chartisolvens]|uniref:Uncharacterized protein n=1 Tax=Anaerobacterium chartisolvens TaxID=1297424 RepID=A0A369B428_9FIRM|nr:hypothetical protein [Anaerobacterium chartisolvens]RCX16310.1 hypothetical protein DFR58_11154 [Anaerobacterium chartisolvens]
MGAISVRQPSLLLGKLNNNDNFINKIVKENYSLLDDSVAMARYRGNIIFKSTGNDTKIIAWQRNILKVRSGYSSAPCILTLTIDGEGKIKTIDVDPSFRGSKGIVCSAKYFDKIVKKLLGYKIDNLFLSKTKTSDTHCFHVTEVLRGVFTAYKLYMNEGCDKMEEPALFYEEENLNSYIEDGALYLSGLQTYNNEKSIRYALRLEDIFEKVCFDENGAMHVYEGAKVEFIINGEAVKSKRVNVNPRDNSFPNFTEFIVECMPFLEKAVEPSGRLKIFNTNTYIFAIIGLLTQSVAIKMFGHNYDYVFHIINNIQRINNVPACVGGLLNQEEADKYYPEFKFSDIFGI